ncbi:MAG TPA: hypothetical protein VG826_30600 [Pirellulales bacterium]|nr:hypothetical protein [Pirellulales bacterium]
MSEPIRRRAIRAALAACAATTFLAMPAESQAIFHWFSNCCGGNSTPTYGAAPLYQAAPVDPCCSPPQVTQTVNYVPQTCYRTQYVTVPVTTYRPVAGRDPCTGCPVTCMRPATTYVQQARMIPYTTYRMVLSNPCCGATTAYTAGYAGVTYAPAASCSGCSGSTAPITYAGPATTTPYYSNTTSSTIVPSAADAASSQPTLAVPPAGGSGTFGGDAGSMQNVQKPIPKARESETKNEGTSEGETGSESGKASGTGNILSPRLFQPNDRTTSYPILRAGTRPVSYRETTPPAAQPTQDTDGWRPSTR